MKMTLIIKIIILLLLISGKAWPSLGDNYVTYKLSRSVDSTIEATAFELGINIPKNTRQFVYIPSLAVFLQNSNLDLKDVTKDPADDGIKTNGAAIGVKAGVLFPTPFFKYTLNFYTSLNFAKTSVQSDPWWGQRDTDISSSRMHQLSLGLQIKADKIITGFTYSFSDLSYMKQMQYIYLGVVY